MKIAITGGTGFVGRNIARELAEAGHEIALIARGHDQTDPTILRLSRVRFFPIGLNDQDELTNALAGCEAVAHCAGINRELGSQTYQRVHVDGTSNIIRAAQKAGVRKIALISFVRARPDCGSAYHESKWAAEELVRNSGLDYTVFKSSVIYGRGDHMLDHLSHAFHTFPVFAFVGFQDKFIRPVAAEDLARIVAKSLVEGACSRKTVAVLGPEQLTLRAAVRRVARAVGRKPVMFPMPLRFHYALGWLVERIMAVPLVSVAQVRMLSEGLAEPLPPCDELPPELAPRIRFTEDQITQGLPAAGPFGLRDIHCCRGKKHLVPRSGRRVFFELP